MNLVTWDGLKIPEEIEELISVWGWRDWMPIQKVAIPAILRGESLLLISPTASGKTEAMWIPALMKARETKGQVVGVYPTRALVSDQITRIEPIAQAMGLTISTNPGSRVFMTTPEGLESMLRDRNQFLPIETIIADEAHRLTDQGRGMHFRLLLGWIIERGGSPLVIGATATPGNAILVSKLINPWNPPKPIDAGVRKPIQVQVFALDRDQVRRYIAKIGVDAPAIIFARSKHQLDRLHQDLRAIGVESFVHHAGVGPSARHTVETRIRSGIPGRYLATVGLEAGIDLSAAADLCHLGLPTSVFSLTQRVGRGRNHHARLSLIIPLGKSDTATHAQVVGAHAMAKLMRMGWSEPPEQVPDPECLATLSGLIYKNPSDGRLLIRLVARAGFLSGQSAGKWIHAAMSRGLFHVENGQVIGDIMSSTGVLPSHPMRKVVTTEDVHIAYGPCPSLQKGSRITAQGQSWSIVEISDGNIVVRPGSGRTSWNFDTASPAWHPQLMSMAKAMLAEKNSEESFSRLRSSLREDQLEHCHWGVRWWSWIGGGAERCLDVVLRHHNIHIRRGFGHIDFVEMDRSDLEILIPRLVRSLKAPDAMMGELWISGGRWDPPDAIRAEAQLHLMDLKGARDALRSLALYLGVSSETLASAS